MLNSKIKKLMLRKIRKPLGMQKELYEHLTVHKAQVHHCSLYEQSGGKIIQMFKRL